MHPATAETIAQPSDAAQRWRPPATIAACQRRQGAQPPIGSRTGRAVPADGTKSLSETGLERLESMSPAQTETRAGTVHGGAAQSGRQGGTAGRMTGAVR